MGQFSWNYADTQNRIPLMLYGAAYVPCPDGTVIYESCYLCYGMFGGHDIYDLVADWNRRYISAQMIDKPERESYPVTGQGKRWYRTNVRWYNMKCRRLEDFAVGKSNPYMSDTYGEDWKRNIGIDIACDDKKNRALKYPIKICRSRLDCYEDVCASTMDIYQGR